MGSIEGGVDITTDGFSTAAAALDQDAQWPAITSLNGSAVKVTHLHYATAVAALGSFSRAAASLGVTQPALSNGIAQLERVVGGRLFNRSTRGADLTALGERSLPLMAEVLEAVDRMLAEVGRAAGRVAEPLRVGVSPLIPSGLLGRVLDAARDALGISVVLREENLAGLRAAVTDRSIDVAIVPSVTRDWSGLRRDLGSEAMYYVPASSAPDSGVPASSVVDVADLAGDRMVLVVEQCGLTTFTRALFEDLGVDLNRYEGEAYSYDNLLEWVALGLGGAVVPESKLDDRASRARRLKSGGRPVEIRYEALWTRASPSHADVAALVAVLEGSPS